VAASVSLIQLGLVSQHRTAVTEPMSLPKISWPTHVGRPLPQRLRALLVLVPSPDGLVLESVAVRPAAQGSGVGGRLLALAGDRARGLGLTEIRLYTNVAMTENLA
jgi:GNAT superfamily N-acetyltransferase